MDTILIIAGAINLLFSSLIYFTFTQKASTRFQNQYKKKIKIGYISDLLLGALLGGLAIII